MKIIFTFLSLLVSFNSWAIQKEITLPLNDYFSSNLVNKVPAYYVWDKKGNPQGYYYGETLDIDSLIPANEHQNNFDFLKKHAVSLNTWDDTKGNVMLIIFDTSLGECPPCDVASSSLQESADIKNAYNVIKLSVVQD